MAIPSVSIIVLTWDQMDLTLDCLRSISLLDYPNQSTVVVDNGSKDNTAYEIAKRFPKVGIIQNETNLGFAEGNNVGIRRALEDLVDYVLILNNDTLVAPNMLTELLDFSEKHTGVGMVGPSVYCLDQEERIFALGSFINWAKGETWHRGSFLHKAHYSHLNDPERVDFISGCCVLVRKELIEQVGMLDSSYYLNFEDVEWAVRAGKHGLESWLVPSAVMWHKVSATLGQASPANTYYSTRNALRFFWDNGPNHLRWLAVSRILGRTLRTIAAWKVKPQYQHETFERRRRANLLALRDFFRGRFGKMGPDVALVCYPS